jgi:hypothetical protein
LFVNDVQESVGLVRRPVGRPGRDLATKLAAKKLGLDAGQAQRAPSLPCGGWHSAPDAGRSRFQDRVGPVAGSAGIADRSTSNLNPRMCFDFAAVGMTHSEADE